MLKGQKLPPLKINNQLKKNQSKQMKNKNKKQQNKVGDQTIANNSNKKQRRFIVDEYEQKAVVLCQFCGGKQCPQQDYLSNKIQPNAIQGLHSNWISEQILAMQRPSNRLIQKFNLLQVFKQYNINTILNLQQPGEHPYCGDGIDPLIGFSYNPQLFFNASIRFQNQFWQDMTSTSFQQMMKIMNIFQRSIVKNKGKISVHCHAGRGRTLMAINAWLIYYNRITAEQTIKLAVEKRQGVLTKNSQRDFLRNFQKQLQNRWKSFSYDLNNNLQSFTKYVQWQNLSLLKSQLKILNMRPFLHGTIIDILRERITKQSKQIIWAFIDLNNQKVFNKKWGNQNQHRLSFLKTYLDKKNVEKIDANQQIRVIVQLLQDFYQFIPFTPINLHAIDQLRNQINVQKSISKNQSQKRKVTKQQLKNKVLKKWEDFNDNKKNIQSNQQNLNKKHYQQNHHNNDLQLQSKQNFMKVTAQMSESQISLPNLKVLSQPSIVHEFGLSSLCTLLDFVKFTKQLIQRYRQQNKQQKELDIQILQKCILVKFSILLQSKKRYFPLMFTGLNNRESKIFKKIQKISKYTNGNIQYLADFMLQIMKQIPNDQNQYKKMIFKIQKVQSNIDYFSKSYSNTGGKFFSRKDAQKVYDQARIE